MAMKKGFVESLVIRVTATVSPVGTCAAPAEEAGAAELAILDGAILDGAILDGAILDGAILDGAILDGAILDGAILDGAILDEPAAGVDAEPAELLLLELLPAVGVLEPQALNVTATAVNSVN